MNKNGPNMVVRGIGEHRIKELLERTSNKKPKKLRQVIVFVLVNECIASDFDIKEVTSSYKKLFASALTNCQMRYYHVY